MEWHLRYEFGLSRASVEVLSEIVVEAEQDEDLRGLDRSSLKYLRWFSVYVRSY